MTLRAYTKEGDAVAQSQDLVRITTLLSSRGQRSRGWLSILANPRGWENKPLMNVGKPSFTTLLPQYSEKAIDYNGG